MGSHGTVGRFARLCALDVAHLWNAPEVVVRYLRTGDEEIRTAAYAAAYAADAAYAHAANAAAYAAANAAAYAAVHDAARPAAYDVAHDAARDRQRRRLASMVMAEARRRGVAALEATGPAG